MIKIHDKIYAIETALYLEEHKTLIVSDLHFGFEENLHRQGVLVPKRQYEQMMEQLKRIISKAEVEKIILNGDVKHEFGTITRQEWKDVNNFLDFCAENFKEILIIKGNHDPILKFLIRQKYLSSIEERSETDYLIKGRGISDRAQEPPVPFHNSIATEGSDDLRFLTNKRKINEVREINIGDVLITHGDYVPSKLNKVIIIGHEHPAIILKHEAKWEKYKCFLKGNFEDSLLIVQPSFNPLIEGSDFTKEKKKEVFLKGDLSEFEILIYDDSTKEVLYFGSLHDLE